MKQISLFIILCCSFLCGGEGWADQISLSKPESELDRIFYAMFPDFSTSSDYVYFATFTPEAKIPLDDEGDPIAFEDPGLATSYTLANTPICSFEGYWWDNPEAVALLTSGKSIPMVSPFCDAFWDDEQECLCIYLSANTKKALDKLQDPVYIHLIPRGDFCPHPDWVGFGDRLLVSKKNPQVVATFSGSSILEVLSSLGSKITIDNRIMLDKEAE